jgi:phosphoribosyl-ATP pyrophosphohydrolase
MTQDILQRLTETLAARRQASPESSYVAKLFSKGEDAILKKVGEEATEVILASKAGMKPPICGFIAWYCWRSMV